MEKRGTFVLDGTVEKKRLERQQLEDDETMPVVSGNLQELPTVIPDQ